MSDETNRTPDPDLTQPLSAPDTDLTQPLSTDAAVNEDATSLLPATEPTALEPQVSEPAAAVTPSVPSAPEPELEEPAPTFSPSAPSAFDPRITGEESLSMDTTQPRIPAPDAAAAQPWSSYPRTPTQPIRDENSGVRFGLLTWAIVLVVMGGLLLVAPVAQYINWGTTTMAVFAVLGIFMLVVALIVAIRDRRN